MYLTYLVIFVQTLGEIISQELFLSSLLDLLSKKKKKNFGSGKVEKTHN